MTRNVADDASNPNKSTLVDNDRIKIVDSESNPNSYKEVLWSLIKSTLNSPTLTSAALGNLLFYDGSAWRNIGGLKHGEMINGKISVTVASNNITVALKTRSGADPSATDPVIVNINDTYRLITGALSVTKNAGTNWFNSGSSELATKEIDYFVYLVWNTTPATDVIDIGFARIPNGRVYSDFSGTTTNAKYLAYANASAPTSTDDCVLIGRFAATLSASASFNWSVPTFTNSNLIQHPIFETRWLTYVPTLTGYSANPTNTVYRYRISGMLCYVELNEATAGTSNATTKTYSLPIAAQTLTNWASYAALPTLLDNGALAAIGYAQILSAATSIGMFKSTGAAWTASGSAAIIYCGISYNF